MYPEQQEVPVKEGEVYEVTIEGVGGKGDGIAKVKGFVLFVPGTQKGDFVKIKVTKVLRNMGFAEVVGKAEQPPREKKYETVAPADLEQPEEESQESYEDTEDFGDDSEDDAKQSEEE